MRAKPTVLKGPLPGQAVDEHLAKYGRLPSEYAEGCPFSDKTDITCAHPKCGCLRDDDEG